jgi:hypothetical protein
MIVPLLLLLIGLPHLNHNDKLTGTKGAGSEATGTLCVRVQRRVGGQGHILVLDTYLTEMFTI